MHKHQRLSSAVSPSCSTIWRFAIAQPHAETSFGAPYETLAQKYRPVFQRIHETVLQREHNRQLGVDVIQWLKQAGFGVVRVPAEYGDDGATLPQLFQLLIEPADADSNIVQALRGHFAFVEDHPDAPRDADNEAWLRRFVTGDLVGSAWAEIGDVTTGDVITRTSRRDGRWVANGRKYYSTGSIFADWMDLYARPGDGTDVIAAVSSHQPGVTHHDDWNGFDQCTTDSGTSVYENAAVEDENIFPFSSRFKYQTAFHQLFHLATLTGIARAITHEVAQQVHERKHIFSTGDASAVAQDAQMQQVVGEISVLAYTAEAMAIRATFAVQRAYDARWADDTVQERQANTEAELESAQGQVAISDLVLRASTRLFNAFSASTTVSNKALDRHWRNARTAALHNPLIYKVRIVSGWHINGTEPPYVWQTGAEPDAAATQPIAKAA